MGFLGRISPPSRDRTATGGRPSRRPPLVQPPSLSPARPTPGAGSVTAVEIARDAITPSKVSPLFMQTGSITISLSSASQGSGTFTFAQPFNDTPRVFVTTRSVTTGTADAWNAAAASVTSTDCTVRIRHVDGTSATVDVTVSVMAVDVNE